MTNNVNYGKAPYNFVPLPEKIVSRYKSPNELPTHDASKEEDIHLLSGEITFNIVAQNPILVADESKPNELRKFNKNADGTYEIPGSSLRGLIRSAVSVLSLSDWTKQMDDDRFFYRAVADSSSKLGKHYKTLLDVDYVTVNGKKEAVPQNVQAGYIVKLKDDEYCIYPAKSGSGRHGKTYYKVNSGSVTIRRNEFENKVVKGFDVDKVKFSLDETGKVVKLFHNDGRFNGYLLYSGFIKMGKTQKVSAYLINEIDLDQKTIELSKRDVKAYKADLKFRISKFQNGERREKMRKFFELPDKIGVEHAKPCFYIHEDGVTYFGFTAFLKLLFPYSTKGMLPEHILNKELGIDYTSALFGFTSNEEKDENSPQQGNYASRLHFHSALVEGDVKPLEPVSILPGSPRASAYRFYLNQDDVQNNDVHTYLTKDTTIQGMKQYWVKDVDVPYIDEKNRNNVANLELLPKNTVFKAKISFDQLHKDELGLLLWALKGPKFHQLGMGKPFGFGVVSFENIECTVTSNEKMYEDLTDIFQLGQAKIDVDEYIETYKTYMKNNLKENGLPVDELEKLESIQIFFAMKEKAKLAKEYMQYTGLKQYSKVILPSAKRLLKEGQSIYQQKSSAENKNQFRPTHKKGPNNKMGHSYSGNNKGRNKTSEKQNRQHHSKKDNHSLTHNPFDVLKSLKIDK